MNNSNEVKPLIGVEKYPEFKKVVSDIVKQTITTINRCADIPESKMPYKRQFVLEEVIKQLQDLV